MSRLARPRKASMSETAPCQVLAWPHTYLGTPRFPDYGGAPGSRSRNPKTTRWPAAARPRFPVRRPPKYAASRASSPLRVPPAQSARGSKASRRRGYPRWHNCASPVQGLSQPIGGLEVRDSLEKRSCPTQATQTLRLPPQLALPYPRLVCNTYNDPQTKHVRPRKKLAAQRNPWFVP